MGTHAAMKRTCTDWQTRTMEWKGSDGTAPRTANRTRRAGSARSCPAALAHESTTTLIRLPLVVDVHGYVPMHHGIRTVEPSRRCTLSPMPFNGVERTRRTPMRRKAEGWGWILYGIHNRHCSKTTVSLPMKSLQTYPVTVQHVRLRGMSDTWVGWSGRSPGRPAL